MNDNKLSRTDDPARQAGQPLVPAPSGGGCGPAIRDGLVDALFVSIASQRMTAYSGNRLVSTHRISTALAGPGERKDSGCTPRGKHYIRAKIGQGLPLNAVLRGRRWTGEICTPELHAKEPQRDWILTRILWLSGCEPGHNRLGNVDTFQRYIYIHGTPELEQLGQPVSHGCIRMDNRELIELFNQVAAGTLVHISA